MEVVLNIGLDKVVPEGQSYTNGQRNPAVLERLFTAIQHLRNWKMAPVRAELRMSDTEPTLVAVLDWGTRSMAELVLSLNEVSIELNQDCIALYVPRQQRGCLIGPRADAWGAFNPEFFLMPDGSRLSGSQPAAKAA